MVIHPYVKNSGKKLWIMSGDYETVGFPITDDIFKLEKIGADAVLVEGACRSRGSAGAGTMVRKQKKPLR